jgi:hypothetical protein
MPMATLKVKCALRPRSVIGRIGIAAQRVVVSNVRV